MEIHQQLDTKKLFCECPSTIQEKSPDYLVKRKIRAVVGETGEIDIAAAEQAMKGKYYLYECNDENVCLIDIDEEPPRNIREEALDIAIQAGKIFKSKFVDEVQVMRKTVVDGSNTTGFQRTALVAMNGNIELGKEKISIPTVIIEEDSGRIIAEDSDKTVFRLDRLGIPLLEISTGPDITSPSQCAEAAEKIGLLLRSLKVRRGLGTIRQDVNVSIEGGTRVEIKGAQDLALLPKLVELEAMRQEKLLEIKKEFEKRGVKSITAQISDLSSVLSSCQSNLIQNALKNKRVVLGIRVPAKGLLGKEIQPKTSGSGARRLGTELSDRAKTASGVKGLFHSDELPNYGITKEEADKVCKLLECGPQDSFVLVADTREKATRALQAAIQRLNEALKGVPKEVRKANEDGTTTFLRMMPGAARLYPETDVLPVRLTEQRIKSVELPELIENKIKRYEKTGLGKDLAELAGKSNYDFDKFVKEFSGLKPAYIAEVMLTAEKTIRRQFNIQINPTEEDFETLFEALSEEKISKESVLEILKENKPVSQVITKYQVLSDRELEQEVKKIISENKGMQLNALIGKAMQTLRGKASGQKIVEMIKKLSS